MRITWSTAHGNMLCGARLPGPLPKGFATRLPAAQRLENEEKEWALGGEGALFGRMTNWARRRFLQTRVKRRSRAASLSFLGD